MTDRPDYLPAAFANVGDKNTIPEDAPPEAQGLASLEEGFPDITSRSPTAGGLPPKRDDFNGILNWLSEFALWGQVGGKAVWDVRVNTYKVNNIVFGSDGFEYRCIGENGAGTTTADPVGDTTGKWEIKSKKSETFPTVQVGNITRTGTTFTKTSGNSVVDEDGFYSVKPYTNGCSISYVEPVGRIYVGLSETQTIVEADFEFAIRVYHATGLATAYNDGLGVASTAVTVDSIIELIYDGVNVLFRVDGVTFHTMRAGVGKTYYLASTSTEVNAYLRNLEWQSESNNNVVNALSFGDDDVALQAATDSMTGGTLFLPIHDYTLNDKWTITSDNIDIVVQNGATITHTVIGQTTPTKINATAIEISGDSCSFTGGEIISPESWDGFNDSTKPEYGVIWVTGEYVDIANVTLTNVQRTGITFDEADHGTAIKNTIRGNFPAQDFVDSGETLTNHFGIFYNPSTDCAMTIENNDIDTCVQGVFFGNYGGAVNAVRTLITSNTFTRCINHGVYANSGTGLVIDSNIFYGSQIPIVTHGSYNIVSSNVLYTSTTGTTTGEDITGMSIRDANSCEIIGNIIKGDGDSGSVIINLTNTGDSTSVEVSNNIVAHNIIDIAGYTSPSIVIGSSSVTEVLNNNKVHSNTIRSNGGNSTGNVVFISKSPTVGYDNQFYDNTVTMTGILDGLFVTRQERFRCTGNTFKLEFNASSTVTLSFINFVASVNNSKIKDNTFICESVYGNNISLKGISMASTCTTVDVNENNFFVDATSLDDYVNFNINSTDVSYYRNRLGSKNFDGIATMMTGQSSITVLNGNAINKNGGNVVITPNAAAGAAAMASFGYYITYVNEESFTVNLGSGSLAANFAFTYHIY